MQFLKLSCPVTIDAVMKAEVEEVNQGFVICMNDGWAFRVLKEVLKLQGKSDYCT